MWRRSPTSCQWTCWRRLKYSTWSTRFVFRPGQDGGVGPESPSRAAVTHLLEQLRIKGKMLDPLISAEYDYPPNDCHIGYRKSLLDVPCSHLRCKCWLFLFYIFRIVTSTTALSLFLTLLPLHLLHERQWIGCCVRINVIDLFSTLTSIMAKLKNYCEVQL